MSQIKVNTDILDYYTNPAEHADKKLFIIPYLPVADGFFCHHCNIYRRYRPMIISHLALAHPRENPECSFSKCTLQNPFGQWIRVHKRLEDISGEKKSVLNQENAPIEPKKSTKILADSSTREKSDFSTSKVSISNLSTPAKRKGVEITKLGSSSKILTISSKASFSTHSLCYDSFVPKVPELYSSNHGAVIMSEADLLEMLNLVINYEYHMIICKGCLQAFKSFSRLLKHGCMVKTIRTDAIQSMILKIIIGLELIHKKMIREFPNRQDPQKVLSAFIPHLPVHTAFRCSKSLEIKWYLREKLVLHSHELVEPSECLLMGYTQKLNICYALFEVLLPDNPNERPPVYGCNNIDPTLRRAKKVKPTVRPAVRVIEPQMKPALLSEAEETAILRKCSFQIYRPHGIFVCDECHSCMSKAETVIGHSCLSGIVENITQAERLGILYI